MEYAILATVAASLIAAGAYLEHKFGSKLAARVAALEAKVIAAESAAKGATNKAPA